MKCSCRHWSQERENGEKKFEGKARRFTRGCPRTSKRGSITVPLTSCLTGLALSVLRIKTKIVSCHTANSKPVNQEVNGTEILPPFSIPWAVYRSTSDLFTNVRLGWRRVTVAYSNSHIMAIFTTIKCYSTYTWGLYYKAIRNCNEQKLNRFYSKLACLSTPVELTDSIKDSSFLCNLSILLIYKSVKFQIMRPRSGILITSQGNITINLKAELT